QAESARTTDVNNRGRIMAWLLRFGATTHENGARRTARRQSIQPKPWKDLVFLGRQNLTAAIGAGLQVDVVRAAQLARVLVLDVRVGPQGVVGAAHIATGGRYFALRNGHVRLNLVFGRRTWR